MPAPESAPAAHVVLAVKDLCHGKSRLAGTLSADQRAALVLAMLTDTLDAALRSPEVAAAYVVTRDDTVAQAAQGCGATVIADPAISGLNAALEHAAEMIDARPVLALQPDLPALRTQEISTAVVAARRLGARHFAADRHGTGTTMLTSSGGVLRALFGPDSAAAHQNSGAIPLTDMMGGLRCDVDTLEDLAAAVVLGVGRATRAVLGRWGQPATVQEHGEKGVLLRTDGGEAVHCSPAAATVGGWRHLRAGQRVQVHRDTAGQVVLLSLGSTAAPG